MTRIQVLVGDLLSSAKTRSFMGGDLPVIASPHNDVTDIRYCANMPFYTTGETLPNTFSIIHHGYPTSLKNTTEILTEIFRLAVNKHHTTIFLTSLTSPTVNAETAATVVATILPDFSRHFRAIYIVIPPELDILPTEYVFDEHLQQQVLKHLKTPRPADWYRLLLLARL